LPVNKEDGVKVIICGDGKQFVLPEDIQEVQFDSKQMDEETQRMIDDLHFPIELKASFDMPVPPGELLFVWNGLCTWKQIQQNNWRRLHGLPMRRRKR
jgi:hypothetical protein